MPAIIIKGKSLDQRKDELHRRRKQLAEDMRPGMMSRRQMLRGHNGDGDEDQQTHNYDKWKDHNKQNMEDWHSINREFKKNGDEGLAHSLDDIRPDGKMRFD